MESRGGGIVVLERRAYDLSEPMQFRVHFITPVGHAPRTNSPRTWFRR